METLVVWPKRCKAFWNVVDLASRSKMRKRGAESAGMPPAVAEQSTRLSDAFLCRSRLPNFLLRFDVALGPRKGSGGFEPAAFCLLACSGISRFSRCTEGIGGSDETRTGGLLGDRPPLHTQAAPVGILGAIPSAIASNQ